MKLTRPQIEELKRLRDLAMPRSFAAKGWPGFPEACVDLRVMGSLHRLGLVESGIHQFGEGRERRGGIWWRITNSGRAALEAAE